MRRAGDGGAAGAARAGGRRPGRGERGAAFALGALRPRPGRPAGGDSETGLSALRIDPGFTGALPDRRNFLHMKPQPDKVSLLLPNPAHCSPTAAGLPAAAVLLELQPNAFRYTDELKKVIQM